MGSHPHIFCVAAALSLFLLLLPTFAISATAASSAPALPAGSTPKLTLPSPPSSASSAGGPAAATTKQQQQVATSTTVSIVNSNSVLVALLDSQYTELAELVEKALLLPALEHALAHHINLTIFAPRNDALDDRNLDPTFRRFLLEPGNLRSLQTLLLSHVLPSRIDAASWPSSLLLPGQYPSLNPSHHLHLRSSDGGDKPSSSTPAADNNNNNKSCTSTTTRTVDLAAVVHADAVVRPDGVIHGIDRLLVPRSLQEDFNRRRSLATISAVLPVGAPEVDPRSTHRLKRPAPAGSPPALPIYDALAPGPALAPAPAPGPGVPHGHFNGMRQVKDFIQTLLQFRGYNEMADILVNLTSMATEMGRLVSEGYVLTVLAPNDEAMGRLTADQLSEAGAPEQIMYYHLIPEYQTEESMYNAVRRFGGVRYDTLRIPHRVVSREADGTVRFGHGEGSAYLVDPDIYTDGRISVQGIDAVLFPPDPEEVAPATKAIGKKATDPLARSKPAAAADDKPRRGHSLSPFSSSFLFFLLHAIAGCRCPPRRPAGRCHGGKLTVHELAVSGNLSFFFLFVLFFCVGRGFRAGSNAVGGGGIWLLG